jgi:hypothetical protein
MRGLFENILYLIPIALFIAFRIMGARNKQNKKPPQKTQPQQSPPVEKPAPGGILGELIKQIQEAQKEEQGEGYREARKVSSAAPKRPAAKKSAEAKKNKPAEKPTGKYHSFLDDEKPVAAEVKIQEDIAGQKAAAAQPFQTGISLQGLTSLQQAVAWAEILGQPKGLK